MLNSKGYPKCSTPFRKNGVASTGGQRGSEVPKSCPEARQQKGRPSASPQTGVQETRAMAPTTLTLLSERSTPTPGKILPSLSPRALQDLSDVAPRNGARTSIERIRAAHFDFSRIASSPTGFHGMTTRRCSAPGTSCTSPPGRPTRPTTRSLARRSA